MIQSGRKSIRVNKGYLLSYEKVCPRTAYVCKKVKKVHVHIDKNRGILTGTMFQTIQKHSRFRMLNQFRKIHEKDLILEVPVD